MNVDILVSGGGLVGASLACALRGLAVAIIDQQSVARAPAVEAGFDSRIYALSPGNAAFLGSIGAWDRMPPGAATPVHGMRVRGDDGKALLEFDAWETGVAELAWIVEDRLLQAALRDALATCADATLLAPARCAALSIDAGGVAATLDGGERIEARLVVGADGAGSLVRQNAGIAVHERPYGHSAVVANFACEKPHGCVARQWFQGGPVLALLPLPGRHVSMVWSTHDAEAARLAGLEPEALCRAVGAAAGGELGGLCLVTSPRVFPLRRISAARTVAHRVALVGDAAHVLHPLAGQGANLGFQDAKELAEVLASRAPGRDPGDLGLLRKYERARAEDILAMDATVHGLFSLFGAASPAVKRARNAGLQLVDRMAVVKNLLMRHAMH